MWGGFGGGSTGRRVPVGGPTVEEVDDDVDDASHWEAQPTVEEPDEEGPRPYPRGREHEREMERAGGAPPHGATRGGGGRDPFDDPFFTSGRMGGGLLGGGGLFGRMGGLMEGMMRDPFFGGGGGASGGGGDPFFGGGGFGGEMMVGSGGGLGGGMSRSSFVSSSSFSSTNGVTTFSSQKTMRAGPDGTHEVTETVRDGRTGRETVSLTRGIGDRQRKVMRTLDHGTGEEMRQNVLRGIRDDEQDHFEREWQARAHRSGIHGAEPPRGNPRLGYR